MIEFARQALGLSESVSIEIAPLAGRGSDRSFFRLTWSHADSAILVHYDPNRVENTYYGDIALFLDDIHVPVPRLIGHERIKCLMLMEDLGDTDLWALKNAPWETRGDLYRKTLVTVHRLHSFLEKDFPGGRVKLMEGFGPAPTTGSGSTSSITLWRVCAASGLSRPLGWSWKGSLPPLPGGFKKPDVPWCTGISNPRT